MVIDATLGGAGHARALLEAHPDLPPAGHRPGRRRPGGRQPPPLDALRRPGDPAAGPVRPAGRGGRGTGRRPGRGGVLFDLGVSSPQLDRAERGFSYRHDGPARHAHGPHARPSPRPTWSTATPRRELASVLRRFGDERYAARIARAVVAARPVTTTTELADLVRDAIPAPARRRGGHPAKRTFQAIRIEVNARARHPGRHPRPGHRPAGPRRAHRRALVPLGRGPHREGPPAPGRDRRLHVPARPALRVRRRAPVRLLHPWGLDAHRRPSARSNPEPTAPASGRPNVWPPRLLGAEPLSPAEADRPQGRAGRGTGARARADRRCAAPSRSPVVGPAWQPRCARATCSGGSARSPPRALFLGGVRRGGVPGPAGAGPGPARPSEPPGRGPAAGGQAAPPPGGPARLARAHRDLRPRPPPHGRPRQRGVPAAEPGRRRGGRHHAGARPRHHGRTGHHALPLTPPPPRPSPRPRPPRRTPRPPPPPRPAAREQSPPIRAAPGEPGRGCRRLPHAGPLDPAVRPRASPPSADALGAPAPPPRRAPTPRTATSRTGTARTATSRTATARTATLDRDRPAGASDRSAPAARPGGSRSTGSARPASGTRATPSGRAPRPTAGPADRLRRPRRDPAGHRPAGPSPRPTPAVACWCCWPDCSASSA